MTATKQQRELSKVVECISLVNKTPVINSTIKEAEPYVKLYWKALEALWQQPVGYKEADKIKEMIMDNNLKELNKKYNLLLKK